MLNTIVIDSSHGSSQRGGAVSMVGVVVGDGRSVCLRLYSEPVAISHNVVECSFVFLDIFVYIFPLGEVHHSLKSREAIAFITMGGPPTHSFPGCQLPFSPREVHHSLMSRLETAFITKGGPPLTHVQAVNCFYHQERSTTHSCPGCQLPLSQREVHHSLMSKLATAFIIEGGPPLTHVQAVNCLYHQGRSTTHSCPGCQLPLSPSEVHHSLMSRLTTAFIIKGGPPFTHIQAGNCLYHRGRSTTHSSSHSLQ
ncbi:hypothetical protein J6590_079202 [Homalodisca vitripennis]|nr:hypothetical protein J6590_079202 [Homalodisca vitripennis]